ncbi:peptidyl-prolyl cis-trans isomerase cyp11-like isoform X1 [Prosopis cineraria]|uniref:peptidyl-prolyl cis-trans isomerase cyp11-like isoform X1 n=1 Tax=Prosopis cineraria TaxID=364024 RepID=UPI00240EED36|nr:peptidyl-prolyl cis-trans isomerase cyp11-like isoform X1 [Prosopis cineraria]
MAKKKNPLVFLDVCIEGGHYERMVFELFFDIAPFTAENFRLLCTGEKGSSPKTKIPLCYKDAYFHEVKEGGSYVKGGAFCYKTGDGGESVYGPHFPVLMWSLESLSKDSTHWGRLETLVLGFLFKSSILVCITKVIAHGICGRDKNRRMSQVCCPTD